MAERSIRPGDLLLTRELELVVIDADHEQAGFEGRRLRDRESVRVPRSAVLAVYTSWTLAPEGA
jgi:hypothetical protein